MKAKESSECSRFANTYFRTESEILSAILIALVMLILSPICTAQTARTGALAGTVNDPSGGVLAGSHIMVTDEASGEARQATTGENGYYSIPSLTPGSYRVEISNSGFKTKIFPRVQIVVTETTVLNVRMELGEVSQTVRVDEQLEQLQTESSALGRVTSGEQVRDLPLAVRNYTQIIGLNPGVATEVTDAGDLGRGGGGNNQNNTVSNGDWSADNNFQMNGVGINDVQQQRFASAGVAIPNPDTIQEFKVQTGQYDASYGPSAGANVNVITKGGTNEFHGSLWEFFRNDVLNANTFFRNETGQARPVLKQNQFGFTLGGPIKKDKLQFFTSYQGTRQRNGLDPSCSATITEAPLTNDRSAAALGKLFAGQTGAFGGTAIAGDGSNINPVALAFLQLKLPNGQFAIPTPQTIDANSPFDSQGLSTFSQPCPFNEDQFVTNADYKQSDRSKFSARFFFADSVTSHTLPQTNLTGGGSPPGFPLNLTQDFRNFSLTHSYVLTPKLLNEVEIGFHRILSTFDQSKVFSYSQVGVTVPLFDNTLPAIAPNVNDPTGLTLGGFGESQVIAQNTFTVQDSVFWSHGRHSFRFGAGISRLQNNNVGFQMEAGEEFLSWADFILGLPAGPANSGGNGTAFSNLFSSLDEPGLFDRAYRAWEGSIYAQDDVKLTRRLTLNLGLRYDHIGDFGDALGRNAAFDVTRADPNPPAAGTLAGTTVPNNFNGPIPAGVTKLNNDFAMNGDGQNTWNPRLGFAWQLPKADRFVLRGGYGVYHSRYTGQQALQLNSAPPFGVSRQFAGASEAAFSEQMPLPLTTPTLPAFVPYSPTTSNSIVTFDPNFRPPVIQEYSLGVQVQLTPSTVFEVGYSGARGLHLFRVRSVNQADFASPADPIRGETTSTLANLPERVPFEGWSSQFLFQLESAGASWYNALLVSLNKRFSHGLQFQASYTFSRDLSTDNQITTFGIGGFPKGNQNDPEARYGRDNFIRPHRLVFNYDYELPKPRNKSELVQGVLGGWTVAGVTTMQTGHYLSVSSFNGANLFGIFLDRAQLTGTCTAGQYVNPGSVTSKLDHYINTSCFTKAPIIGDPEPPGTCGLADPTAPCPAEGRGFGNSGVGILQGPGEVNFDLSMIKHFSLRWPKEGSKLEFRSEFFNIFNHPQFGDPSTSLGSSLGHITTTVVNPRIVQLALKLNF